jgi:hypothetical protein
MIRLRVTPRNAIVKSTISVPISTQVFMRLAEFLRENNSSADPVDIVDAAIEYWLENTSWKKDLMPAVSFTDDNGYTWKEVFLPSGTKLRIKARGEFAYAEVRQDKIYFQEEPVSPSEFANLATGTTRNAWRDVWVRRPTDSDWKVADELRRQGVRSEQGGMSALTESLELDLSDLLAAADRKITYRDDIKTALDQLGGQAHRLRVIQEVRNIRKQRGATIPRTLEETVQQAFERHCVDSEIFCGREEYALFRWPQGKHEGTWALNVRS